VALRDEGSDEVAVEADNKVGVTPPPTDAIQADERNDAGESAEAEVEAVGAPGPGHETGPGQVAGPGADGDAEMAVTADAQESPETSPAAVTEVLPTAERIAAAEPVAAAAASAAAEPIASAGVQPAATVVDMLPGPPAAAGGAGAGSMATGGGAGSGNWVSNVVGGARRPSWKIVTAAGAVAVIVIGLVIVTVNSSAVASHKTTHKKKAEPVTVVSVSPSNGSTGVNGASPITIAYSGRITSRTPLPTLSPSIAGSWQVSKEKATFTPQVGFTENTHVTVNIPAPAGTATTAATSFSFTTGQYSMLRLDQLLSQLGYLPVTWTPTDSSGDIPATDASAQLAAAYDPPSGTFSFDPGYPAALTSQWSVGTNNEVVDGAVRTFEFDHDLNMDGDAGPRVWNHLFTAIAKGEQNQHGYTYVWVTQAGTEHLILYHNGHVAITSPVNTGIAASPTVDGTFPVYLRYTVTQMIGTNPDGTPYDDTVYWVSYFNGGDAVHAFPRGGYGWYQSLGCVELPNYGPVAENVWNLITYGTLVTVTGPVA
jgi:L,D-transpeptidase catalytic domain/Bacterial Ig-like domain